jgi:hypothetical protein
VQLSTAFETRRFVERAQQIRQNSVAAYGIAVAVVAIATILRWAVGPYAMEGPPSSPITRRS